MKFIVVLLLVVGGFNCILSEHSENHHDERHKEHARTHHNERHVEHSKIHHDERHEHSKIHHDEKHEHSKLHHDERHEHSKIHHDRKHKEHSKSHHNNRHFNHRHHLLNKHKGKYPSYRDNTNATCNNTNDVQIFFNGSSNLFGFYNGTAQISIIFNFSSSGYVLILEGGNGTAILSNCTATNPVQLGNVWFSTNQTFGGFFNSWSSSGLLNATQVNNSSNVSSQITQLASNLGINGNASAALSNFYKILNQIGSSVLHNFNFQSTCLQNGLDQFFAILRIIQQFSGAQGFGQNGNTIDYTAIFNARNNLEAFVAFIRLWGSLENLIPVIGPYMRTADYFFAFLVEFGGSYSIDGVNQYINIIFSVFGVSAGQLPFSNLFQYLVQLPNGSLNLRNSDLTGPYQDLIQALGQQNIPAEFQILINYFQNITSNNIFVNGTNVTSFFNSLRNGNSANGSFNATIANLVNLANLFNPAQLFTSFARYILTNSRNFNLNFIPGFNPQTLQNLNFTNLFSNPSNLQQIPFFGDIFNAINSAAHSFSNGSINLSNVFNFNGGGNIPIFDPLGIASGFASAFGSGVAIFGEFVGAAIGQQSGNGNSETSSALPTTVPSSGNSTDSGNATFHYSGSFSPVSFTTEKVSETVVATNSPDTSSAPSSNDTDDKRYHARKHQGLINKIHHLNLKHGKHHEGKKHGAHEKHNLHDKHKLKYEKHNKESAVA